MEEYELPDQPLYQAFKDEKKRDKILPKKIDEEEKMWRIKSLRVAVDEDTRILLLPLPESKRSKKLIDTRYQFVTYGDLYDKYQGKETELVESTAKEYKRMEDKTQEEIADDMRHKRRKQFQNMNTIRKYQFTFFFGALLFYVFAWKHIAPKPVLNSLVYHQAIDLLKKNKVVQNKVGEYFQVMGCSGKIYPLMKNIQFDLTVNGSKDQAKFRVKSEYKPKNSVWLIDDIYMLTKSESKTYKL